MAFKAINDSAGPDRLVPTLLVYSAYPRMTEFDTPSLTILQRAAAIKKAMAEIQKLQAKRQVVDALNTHNGLNTDSIHNLKLNLPVLVWREGNTGQSGSWEGPYRLVSTDSENCVLALPQGNTTFWSTVVKPYLTPTTEAPASLVAEITTDTTGTSAGNTMAGGNITNKDTIVVQLYEPDDGPTQLANPAQPVKCGRGRPHKYPLATITNVHSSSDLTWRPGEIGGQVIDCADITVFLQDEHQFQSSRHKEVVGLLEKGVFEVTSDIPEGVCIFKARFVNEVKNKGTSKAFEKSRLVV
jgi:hypothetical protein